MKLRSLIYIITACALWGTSGLFVNALSPYGFNALHLTSVRALIAFLSMALFSLIKSRHSFKTDPKSLLLFALVGIGIFGTGSLYFASMQMTSVSTAVVLMYTAPIYVMIFSVIFLKEKLTALKLVSVVIMLGGCCLVSGIIGGLKFNALGIVIGALSGVAYAAYNIATKISMQKGNDPISCTMYGFMFMFIVSLFLSSPAEIVTITVKEPTRIIPLLLAIGIITVVIPYFLYTLSLRDIPAGTASSLGILEPMSATLFSVMILGEKLTILSAVGMILILTAVFMLGKAEGKHKEETK